MPSTEYINYFVEVTSTLSRGDEELSQATAMSRLLAVLRSAV